MTADPIFLQQLVILVLLVVSALAAATLRNLLACAMMFSIFSLLMACMYLLLEAPDVAITEAAVGAGISTLLVLATLLLTSRADEKPSRRRPAALLTVLLLGAGLMVAVTDLPAVGDASAPVVSHISKSYEQSVPKDMAIPNIVTAVLAGYRGYDTLGETTVVFTALLAVLLMLSSGIAPLWQAGTVTNPPASPLRDQPVLRIAATALIPFVFLFALYVLFHGKYSPGGGFQAGVLWAVALMVHALVFGLPQTMRHFPLPRLLFLAALGLLIYYGVGWWAVLQDKPFLDYHALMADKQLAQFWGIMLVEAGITLTVGAVMLALFYCFAGFRPSSQKEPR